MSTAYPCVKTCMYCYFNVKRKSNFKGHRGYRASCSMPVMKKPVLAVLQKPTGADGAAAVGEFAKAYPLLWEHISDAQWEDGTARVASTLTVFVEDGLVKLCLNDRSAGATAWASSTGFDEACEALESRLDSGSLEWRKTGWKGKPRK